MSDEQPTEHESSPSNARREPQSNPAPAAPQIDFGAEIRKALDAMIQGGEIEIGSGGDNPPPAQPAPAPRAPAAPPRSEDEETRFERWLEARENRSRRDQEERAFREKVNRKLEAKPRWFDPWRP